jgi:glycosyltransferase involved in cell wall biosynthesis
VVAVAAPDGLRGAKRFPAAGTRSRARGSGHGGGHGGAKANLALLPRLLHILPHPGGGAEVLVDHLTQLDSFEHERLYVSTTRRASLAAPSIAASSVRLRARARRADAVHVIGDVGAMLTVPMLRRRPSVFGTHGLHMLRRVGGVRLALVRRRLRAAVAACDRTTCSSKSERGELLAAIGEDLAPRLLVVPNGIRVPPAVEPAERALARADLGLRDAQVAGLYLGELEPRKRPLTAVEAAERVAARGLPFVLLVAGSGPQARDVQARAGRSVRFLGYRRDPERVLAAADVFVMPSEREGLSLAVLEAMAHGLAVVVSDGPGNPEAVGDAGLVFPVGDVAALADALARVTADAEERTRLSSAARSRARQSFSLDRWLADMETVFASVVAPARGPGRVVGARHA